MTAAASRAETDEIRRVAADWLLRLADGGVETEAACAAWCAADPRHERVFRQMQSLWQATASAAPKTSTARRLTTLLTVLLVLGAIAHGLRVEHWFADARTGMAQTRTIALPDGSLAALNGNSAIDIDYTATQRRLYLRDGEVLVEVQPDAARPFVVAGRDGEARALGTRYLVRQDARSTTVTVIESKVRVTPAQDLGRGIILRAGERARLTAGRVGQLRAAPPDADAWREGRLVFRDAALSKVVAELARQRRGVLRVDAAAGQRLRFTGVLPADDPDRALRLLAGALALDVHELSPYLVFLRPRS